MNSLQLNLTENMIIQANFCSQLEQFMIQHQVSERQRFKIITCAMEGLNNIIEHTSSQASDITLLLHCDQERIVVDLLDKSDFIPITTPSDCPDKEQESGRGMWIMYNWMDQVLSQQTVLGSHLRLSLLRH